MKQVGNMKFYSLDEVTDEIIGKKELLKGMSLTMKWKRLCMPIE